MCKRGWIANNEAWGGSVYEETRGQRATVRAARKLGGTHSWLPLPREGLGLTIDLGMCREQLCTQAGPKTRVPAPAPPKTPGRWHPKPALHASLASCRQMDTYYVTREVLQAPLPFEALCRPPARRPPCVRCIRTAGAFQGLNVMSSVKEV